jgi:hypothetical protein
MSNFGYDGYLENKKSDKFVGNAGLYSLQVNKINKKLKMHSKAVLVDNKYLFI